MSENTREHIERDAFVRAMRQAGSRTFTRELLEADIAAGAPANADGTINILKYIAWIAKEMGDDGQH